MSRPSTRRRWLPGVCPGVWQPDVEQTIRLAAVHEVEVVVGGIRRETRTVPL